MRTKAPVYADRGYPCLNTLHHQPEPVTSLDGEPLGRWVCGVCLMRVSEDGSPRTDSGDLLPLLPNPGIRTRRW